MRGTFSGPVAGATIALLVCLGARSALAHSYTFGSIDVGHIWAPPSGGEEVNVYGPLLNAGTEADALVSATAAIGKSVALRFGTAEEHTASSTLPLMPGVPVSLASWGEHLRVLGLSRPLNAGDSFDLTLTFRKAGTHVVKVVVEAEPVH